MNKKNVLIIIGVLAFIVIIGGISYSYFVYNKSVGDVSLTTGEISIDLSGVNGNKTLTNVIPLSDNDGKTSSDYFDFTVNSTVDTEKIYYEVYILPKSGNTLDTSYLKTYLTDQNNVEIEGITNYDNLLEGEVEDGKVIYRGLVDVNNNGTTKNESKDFRLRMWLDETYFEQTSKTFEFDIYLYAKNLPEGIIGMRSNLSLSSESVTVAIGESDTFTITTDGDGEISCLSSDTSIATCSVSGTTLTVNGIAIGRTTITISQDKGSTHLETSDTTYAVRIRLAGDPYVDGIVCQRVTDAAQLHTEICSQNSNSYYCKKDGYALNSTITYGNAKALNSALAVGDAFDCDVNGDGIVNKDGNGKSTERFYYVSEYYNTNTQTFDDSTGYAALIYYYNFVDGSPSDGAVAYDSSGSNKNGPSTSQSNLPRESTWTNVRLKTNTRAILAEEVNIHNSTTAGGYTLPTAFSYGGNYGYYAKKAARFLTAQELMRGCGLSAIGNFTPGELSTNCKFLLQGTRYSKSSNATDGILLETPRASNTDGVWQIASSGRYVGMAYASDSYYGARPVIDVPVSSILK